MNSQTTTANITQLFANAGDDQNLSAGSVAALQVIDIGQNIQNAMGAPASTVEASSVILVSGLIDDSSSIQFAGNSDIVREGVNMVPEALKGSKQHDSVLMGLRYLNQGIVTPFQTLDQVPTLDAHNYNPCGGTPLYKEMMNTLATVIAKTQEFSDNQVPVRSITFVVTDGGDTDAGVSPRKIKTVVEDMLKSEQHIVAGIGIDDGSYDANGNLIGHRTDFQKVFGDMGIPAQWIIDIKCPPLPGESDDARKARLRSQIRHAFQTVSQSAKVLSQAAATQFSQSALGGFAGLGSVVGP